MKKNYVLTALLSLAVWGLTAQERTVSRVATENATVYFENQSNANGKAEKMVLSGTAGENAVILLKFDLSDLPTDASVQEVSLTLNFTDAPTIALTPRIGELKEAWTEGPADPADVYTGEAASNGDATWVHSSYSTNWSEGDVEQSVDQSQLLSVGTVTSSSTVITVTSSNNATFEGWVKEWIAEPDSNRGFAIVTSANANAQMHSRHSSASNARPTLEIVYEGDPPASVENKTVDAENVRIYPNPAKHNLNVTGLNEQITSLEVVDISGRVLRVIPQSHLNTVNTEINLSDIAADTYFLKIKSENGQSVKTFIVR